MQFIASSSPSAASALVAAAMSADIIADIQERAKYINTFAQYGDDRSDVTAEQYKQLIQTLSETGGLTVREHTEVMEALSDTEAFTQNQLIGVTRALRMHELKRGASKPRRPMQTCSCLQHMLLQSDWDTLNAVSYTHLTLPTKRIV